MRIDRALELLEIEDSKYGSMEDKNYYLVHKYNDILKEIAIEDLKILQNIIFKKYKPQKPCVSGVFCLFILKALRFPHIIKDNV